LEETTLFKEDTMNAFFPSMLLTYLELFGQLFSSPSYSYFKAYIWGMLIVDGRKCITKIGHACFFLDRHIASFERFLSENKWDMNQVARILVRLLVDTLKDKLRIHEAFLLAVDTTHTAKNSKKMIGIQKWTQHSGNADRGKCIIGHHWGIAGLISHFANRFLCWPILTMMISGKKNPSHYVSGPDGLCPMTFWVPVLAMVFQTWQFLDEQALRVVVDAYFANTSFINPLIEKGIHVVTRWQKNGVGWDDPGAYSGKGRPRKYGKKWKLADLLKSFSQEIKVDIYGKSVYATVAVRDMWLRNIPQKVRVVVVKTAGVPIIFISTDMTLTAEQIIEIYSSRFSIEIAIRDLKQHFGMGDYQCTTTSSILRFVRLSCVSLCLWRLMLLPENVSSWLSESTTTKTKMISESEFSFARARRGLKMFVIKRILFPNSASQAELDKVEKEYEAIFRIAG
jgi:hypothetical protein